MRDLVSGYPAEVERDFDRLRDVLGVGIADIARYG
jgi:hypothetical protein